MPRRSVRRGQLIAPFGPGAMLVAPDGVSLIAAGLDHWHELETPGNNDNVDPHEFVVREWRLERELRVTHFRLPPDYRTPRPWQPPGQRVNVRLTVPFLRFPQWHVCPNPKCQRLEPWPLTLRDIPRCTACGASVRGRSRRRPQVMVQVRFIAMCDRGHIQDFPWREWVHRDPAPSCLAPLRLRAGGSASLAAIRVECECGAWRTLEGITKADPPTFLTSNLATGTEFPCGGGRPWLGDTDGEGCGRPLWGSLRGATNVHFSHVRSAIYLPRGRGLARPELVERLERPVFQALIGMLLDMEREPTPNLLRRQGGELLRDFTDEEITAALGVVLSGDGGEERRSVEGDDPETSFRRAEFETLREPRTEAVLITSPQRMDAYASDVARYFHAVTLVPKLRETRALAGFGRVFPENDLTLEDRKALLWREARRAAGNWLPAYVVHGEGIYLEFDEERLREWEARSEVQSRVASLARRYRDVQERRHLQEREITPRFVLLHTFAHLFMDQLTFDCGYGTASLRERLYVSASTSAPMAGVLVYTAAGDADGTMGGLVRMGKPARLEQVIRRAIRNARWCSSDPVCMELGSSGGQGPDSCNLAACHNCALVPETSCEQFNRFLDRGLVVGTIETPPLGFFSSLAST